MPRKTPSKKKAAAAGRKKKRTESFSMYIYKVLKQVHPDTGATPARAVPRPGAPGRRTRAASLSAAAAQTALSSRPARTAVR